MLIIIYIISLIICYFNCRNYYKINKEVKLQWVDFLFVIFPVINSILAFFFILSDIFDTIKNIDLEKIFNKINNFMHKYFSEKLLYKIFLLKKQ